MELSQIARVALGGQLHTMLTSETTIDNHHHTMLTPKTTVHTFAQLHTTHPRSPKPKLGHWKTILYTVPRIIITPLSSTYRRSLSQFVLCGGGPRRGTMGYHGGYAGVQGGVGGWPDWTQISQPGLKIAPRSTPWHGQPTGSSLLLVLPMSVGTRRGFQRYSGFQFSV